MTGRSQASEAASDVEFTLDQRLCLALYTASRAMTARYRVALGQLGLTYPQYLVMVLLWEEGTCSVGGIGHRLSLDSSTLSPLLKRLQAMDLVTRTRATSDERLMLVGLTERGAQLQEDASQVTVDICEATGITVAQQLELVSTLRELTVQLDASTTRAAAKYH
jgi:MarR family transcriptional regulator, organic hydroperoxide resistance regulator